MTKTILLVAACTLALSGAAFADMYKMDDKGKCRDDHNKFVKAEMCEHHMYKFDAKKKCRDEKGHFVDGKFCHA
jgi:hypothetical protein